VVPNSPGRERSRPFGSNRLPCPSMREEGGRAVHDACRKTVELNYGPGDIALAHYHKVLHFHNVFNVTLCQQKVARRRSTKRGMTRKTKKKKSSDISVCVVISQNAGRMMLQVMRVIDLFAALSAWGECGWIYMSIRNMGLR